MSGPSKIEWTEATWNPIVGCSIVSPGCTNCYAMRMAARIERMGSAPHYAGLTKVVNGNPVWTGKLAQAPEHIWLEPLQRRKPTMYFVNSMSDLFHEDVPDEWIDRAFAVMALCPQHTFQVLTKRSERMRKYVTIGGSSWRVLDAMCALTDTKGATSHWPLPNVWLGVSTERQQEADQRIPDLLATYAAVRFVSAEPLLGPIDFRSIHDRTSRFAPPGGCQLDALSVHVGDERALDWIIVGGESGRDARPMHPDWARSIRDQSEAAGVAFFFKQWGEHEPLVAATDMQDHLLSSRDRADLRDAHERSPIVWPDGGRVIPENSFDWWEAQDFDAEDGDESQMAKCAVVMRRVGKKTAGRVLDRREWNEMPATPSRQPKQLEAV